MQRKQIKRCIQKEESVFDALFCFGIPAASSSSFSQKSPYNEQARSFNQLSVKARALHMRAVWFLDSVEMKLSKKSSCDNVKPVILPAFSLMKSQYR